MARTYQTSLLLLLIFTIAGCQDDKKTEDLDLFLTMGELPGLKETNHQGLREEYARLVDEDATPRLLQNGTSMLKAPEENGAEILRSIFTPDQLKRLPERSRELFPQGEFEFNPVQLIAAQTFLNRYRSQRDQFVTALEMPHWDFQFPHTEGLLADTSFSHAAAVVNRLEAFVAAMYLKEGKLTEAYESIERMFRITQIMSQQQRIEPRIRAVHMREEALQVLVAYLQHPKLSRLRMLSAHQLLQQQLASWPEDSRSLIGDRALGLHTYEMIRDGHLLSLITADEVMELQKEGELRLVADAIMSHLESDEMYYLDVMRSMIEHARKPFYQRISFFEDLQRQQFELRNRSNYPIAAVRLLLHDLPEAQRLMALDQARVLSLELGLRKATGMSQEPAGVNPLSGEKLISVLQEQRVFITEINPADASESYVIPLKLNEN